MIVLIRYLLVLVSMSALAQPSLQKIWETDPLLADPECVLVDQNILYVSQVNGEPLNADGKGAIAKLNRQGKIINKDWVKGLNAPKGMVLWKGMIYVTDITKVVVINIRTGAIDFTIPINGSAGLNAIAVDKKGTLYVSDSKLGHYYRIVQGRPELYLTNLSKASGLKIIGNDLYMLTERRVDRVTPAKKRIKLASIEPGGDGIQPVGNGDFIVTCHTGLMYYLAKDGTLKTLLDTRAQHSGTADIGYDPVRRLVYVPTLAKNTVVAYRLN